MPASASLIPIGATQTANSSGNVAAATAAATLAAVAGRLNYITGFSVSGSGATLGLPVTVTITGLLGGTQSYTYCGAAGVLIGNSSLNINFPTPMPASAVNTAIVVSCPTLGAGNTNNTTNAWGFYE